MEHLTQEQNEQLQQAITDITTGIETAEIPEGYNIDIPEATPQEQEEIDSIIHKHKVKVAFDNWLNKESRPDWLVGELVNTF